MALRIRGFQLRAKSNTHVFGFDTSFQDGLTVLWADNSMGKSTCIQGMVFALGLEGMLSASRQVPLPHAMTHELVDDTGRHSIEESFVAMEIENGSGERMTVRRWSKSPTRSHDLIETWSDGLDAARAGRSTKRDFFVRRAGAAQHEDGFHHRLALFLGVDLPWVFKYDGAEVPLYLECIFPLMLVEQKHGWAGIQALMPTYFGIRDVAKRAIETLLKLDAYENAIKLLELKAAVGKLRDQWTRLAAELRSDAKTSSAAIQGLPDAPQIAWPPDPAPRAIATDGTTWRELPLAVESISDQITQLKSTRIPRIHEAAQQIELQLRAKEEELGDLEISSRTILEDIQLERNRVGSIKQRLHALEEDLVRNRDASLLQKLGSSQEYAIAADQCPTCHQSITGILLPQDAIPNPMSVEENILLIQSQMAAFHAEHGDSERVLVAKEVRAEALNDRMNELRSEIRTLRRTLLGSTGELSEAAIVERLRLEDMLRRLKQFHRLYEVAMGEFESLSVLWTKALTELRSIESDLLSKGDRAKLARLDELFRAQVEAYGLSSIDTNEITISSLTYRPSHEGFDLGFDLSASDMIRTIWAYLLGLLELSREFDTNHFGLLIFDEPRQQEAKKVSFGELLRRASSSKQAKQQVIFATSEEQPSLRELIKGIECDLRAIEGRVLRALESGSADAWW